jgi:hypothetical protein
MRRLHSVERAGASAPRFPFYQASATTLRPRADVSRASSRAFSLIEVMIAMGIFFMAIFSILALVSQTLRNARALQQPQVDAGMVAAIYVSTNRFTEGRMSGDFGDDLRDYSWDTDTREFATNGLLIVDVFLLQRGLQKPADAFQILVFDPTYRPGPFGGGFRR